MDQSDALLHWYKDETFFSLCSRQHLFLGHTDTATTLEWLFGSEQPMTHDFPSNIRSLSNRMMAAWGAPRSIILERTILPFFIPFQSQARIDAAANAMESTAIGSLKYSLGLLTGRFGAEHPLKSCSLCMNEDRASQGVAYWHLSHQYPGVVLCPVHGVLLKECTANRQWSGRFKWVLPSEQLFAPTAIPNPSKAASDALRQMGEAVVDLASCGKLRFLDPMVVHAVYKSCIRIAGHNAQADTAACLSNYASLLQPYPPYERLPITLSDAEKFVAQMSSKPRGRQHPLRHLALITCLFGQFSAFIKAYDNLSEQVQAETDIKVAAVSNVQKPAPTKAKGNHASRRPKKLKPTLRAEILNALKSGKHKSLICEDFQMSITTVNRLLVSEPEIKAARDENLRADQLAKYRAEWTDVLRTDAPTSPKERRLKRPRLYAWLYRNDRAWLIDFNSKLPCGRNGNHSNVNWLKRDLDLMELINSAIITLRNGSELKNITRADVFSLVPNLSRVLEKREHYPKSRTLLKKTLKLCDKATHQTIKS